MKLTLTKKSKDMLLILFLAAAFLSAGCRHTSYPAVTEYGAHKIHVVARDGGWTKRDGLEERGEGYAVYRRESWFGRNTEVAIKNNQLTVDGKGYGSLRHGDSITVDGDKVLINDQQVQQIASR